MKEPFGHVLRVQAEAAIHVGCGWLLREIELAGLRCQDLSSEDGEGCGTATLRFGATKTDTEAVGCSRAVHCFCPGAACPLKAARKLTWGKAPQESLVTGLQQQQLTKDTMVSVLKAYGQHLGAPTDRITGHSMRASGAQRMARAGISPEMIKAFGRWDSGKQMAKYARDALANPCVIAEAMRATRTRGSPTKTASPSKTGKTSQRRWSSFRAKFEAGAR